MSKLFSGYSTIPVVSFFKDIQAIVYDLDFQEDDVYASTNLGLYKTYNGNIDLWFKYNIEDINNQPLFTDAVYNSVNFQNMLFRLIPYILYFFAYGIIFKSRLLKKFCSI